MGLWRSLSLKKIVWASTAKLSDFPKKVFGNTLKLSWVDVNIYITLATEFDGQVSQNLHFS